MIEQQKQFFEANRWLLHVSVGERKHDQVNIELWHSASVFLYLMVNLVGHVLAKCQTLHKIGQSLLPRGIWNTIVPHS